MDRMELVEQFLNFVWQGGQGSLPYSDEVKPTIHQQVYSLCEYLPTFQPSTTPNMNGSSDVVLEVRGIILMGNNISQGISTIIRLEQYYPYSAPDVYVIIPSHMVSNPHYVQPNGLVSIQYLQGLFHPGSNLVELVQQLNMHFTHHPPMYPNPNPNPNPNPHDGQGSIGSSNSAVVAQESQKFRMLFSVSNMTNSGMRQRVSQAVTEYCRQANEHLESTETNFDGELVVVGRLNPINLHRYLKRRRSFGHVNMLTAIPVE